MTAPHKGTALFELPTGFKQVPLSQPVVSKPHDEPPHVVEYVSEDGTIRVTVTTEHDHDGLDLHRKDRKRAITDAGGFAAFTGFQSDGYSHAGTMAGGGHFHLLVRSLGDHPKTAPIASVLIVFDDPADPRAVDLVRTAAARLSWPNG